MIDTSTLLAILSDYDLTIASNIVEARFILDTLKESAEAEERSGFDASGSSGGGVYIEDRENAEAGGSSRSLPEHEWSSQTDDTSLSQGLSSLDLDDNGGCIFGEELDALDDAGKASLLQGIFPNTSLYTIQWTLKKYQRNVDLAIEDLMTQAFLTERGLQKKGIEAFSEPDVQKKKRKGKKRNGRGGIVDNKGGSSDSPTSPPGLNKWDTGAQDIEFISKRTGVPPSQVSTMYHQNGTSVTATISAIIASHQELKLESDDPVVQARMVDFAHEYPAVPASSLEAILQITHPVIVYAHELAKVLTLRPVNQRPAIEIELRHAPLNLDTTSSLSKTTPYNYDSGMSSADASARASKHYQARDTAYQQAQAAYRKGKSNHLMGGAAAYYSQEGRDADALARGAQSAAADAIIASQNTRSQLDLHGLSVNDAKRITKERVNTWWHELGTTRTGFSRNGPSYYRVIIGQGNHSDRGVAKLGPAVAKMLIRDGWKIEVGENNGILNVTGIAKKK